MTVATITGHSEIDAVPVGGVMQWSHEIPPAGWLLCDGSLVLRDAYPELYQVMTGGGLVFPYGENVTGPAGELTFRLPDMRTRMPRTPSGVSPPAGFNSNVGATGGSASSTHTHTFTPSVSVNANLSGGNHNHSHSNTGTDAPGYNGLTLNFGVAVSPGNQRGLGGGTAAGTAFSAHGHGAPGGHGYGGHNAHGHGVNGFNTSSTGSHNHTVSVSPGNVTPTPIDHHPPYLEVNFVIFAGPNRFYDWWVLGHSGFPATVAT